MNSSPIIAVLFAAAAVLRIGISEVPLLPKPVSALKCDSVFASKPSPNPAADSLPNLSNRSEITSALTKMYAGLGETSTDKGPVFWMLVSETGSVERIRLLRSSGAVAVDSAALRIMQGAIFRPAMHKSQPICFWVAMPTPGPAAPGKNSEGEGK